MTFGPTHWNVKDYVQEAAALVAAKFNCSWNTYYDHPPGLGLDNVSVDFWALPGRGADLSRLQRHRITHYLRHSGQVPAWRWIINGSRGYTPGGGTFEPPGGPAWNRGHVHITFW